MSLPAGRALRPRAWLGALTLAAFVTGLFLIPIESDGAQYSDGIWYGIEMEANPARAIHGNHPMFHLAAWPLAVAARAAGLEHPGHVAYRIVGAAAGAALVWFVGALGGRRAAWFGLAAAGYAAASRMFVLEFSTGENVGPGAASAVAVVWAALDRRRRPVLVGALLALAMTLRQENILLVPGVAMTVFPRGRRRGPLLAFLALTGAAVLALYAIAWRIADPDAAFVRYLIGLGSDGAYAPAPPGTSFASLEVAALGDALVGSHGLAPPALGLLGVAGLLFPVAVAWTRSGSRRLTREAWLFGPPVLLRFFFFGWWEPANPEWQLFALAFSCAAGARLARLARRSVPQALRAGILGTAACGVLAGHLRWTLSLRSTDVRDAILDGVSRVPSGSVMVVEGWSMDAMPGLLGLRFERLRGSNEVVMAGFARILAAHPAQPIFVITGRIAGRSLPFPAAWVRKALGGRRISFLSWKGTTYGVLIE